MNRLLSFSIFVILCHVWIGTLCHEAVVLCFGRGFLVTCPKSLIAGTEERCCVSFVQLRFQRVRFNVLLLPKKNSTAAESVTQYSDEMYIGREYMFSYIFLHFVKNSACGHSWSAHQLRSGELVFQNIQICVLATILKGSI